MDCYLEVVGGLVRLSDFKRPEQSSPGGGEDLEVVADSEWGKGCYYNL
jgi:hypothetical protein